MIKEETYNQVATEFATAIGVAHVIGYKNKREQIKEGGIESFKRIEPDLEINAIVCDSIEFDLYQELQRSIYEIRKTKKKLKAKIDPEIADRAAILANIKKQIAIARVNAQRAATIEAQKKIGEVN